ncbi:hypothetical protein C2U70_22610 [Bradyrhizobium guangdongense]|uniref:hypothetical protein n=1 Tax=Bradyrhizobium guangdongense TaxID=1325090 RepID=UPI001126963C|nr:hypothetical protein [Bradyrhizobium guangdongense]TPQ32117.1 hypothetical protein C2U70_22610 [Bradyrhizobium guangdongense]
MDTRVEQQPDLRTTSSDLAVTRQERIVEKLSTPALIKFKEAVDRSNREAMLIGAGLAILGTIAFGCLGIFFASENAEKLKTSSQILTIVVTALIGFLFTRNSKSK